MNKWKVSFFVCLSLLVLSSVFFLYAVLDQGISYTYLEVSYDDQVKANKVLGNLIVQGGNEYSQKDILHILRQTYPDGFIVEEDNKILMGPNSFEFESGKLVKIR